MHITRCSCPGRQAMLQHSVRSVADFMATSGMDLVLVEMVATYLLAQGSKAMIDCLSVKGIGYDSVAEATDRLRWDSFVEGRIAKEWLVVVKPMLLDCGSSLPVESWGRMFIEKLLQLTHKQWIFRNSRKHFKRVGGLTEQEHQDIFARLEELMWIDPSELLPRHRDLLNVDFCALGEGPTSGRQLWIESMESALSAKHHVDHGRVTEESLHIFQTSRRRRSRRTTPRTLQSSTTTYRRTTRAQSNINNKTGRILGCGRSSYAPAGACKAAGNRRFGLSAVQCQLALKKDKRNVCPIYVHQREIENRNSG